MLRILLNNLPREQNKSESCEEFFNILTSLTRASAGNFACSDASLSAFGKLFMVPESESCALPTYSANALLAECVHQLKGRPTYEDKYSQYTDKILAGYL